MYAPQLGRFINRDPTGYDDGMNTYAYVGNAPTVGLDPFGLSDQVRQAAKAFCQQVNEAHERRRMIELTKQYMESIGNPHPERFEQFELLYEKAVAPTKFSNQTAVFFGSSSPISKVIADLPRGATTDLGPQGEYQSGEVWGVRGGSHFGVEVGALRPGDLVGTGGAGPCVGMLVIEPCGPLGSHLNSLIVVLHFQDPDWPASTLKGFKFAPNTRFVVFGGGGRGVESRVSAQLQNAIDTAKKFPNARIEWVDTPSLYTNRLGDLYIFPEAKE